MPNVLIIHGHPEADSLSSALAERYAAGASAAGAGVRHLRLRELAFDPVAFPGPDTPLEPALLAAQEALRWSDHIAVFFPIWWSTAPALLKAFFDRTLLSGFAYRYNARGLPEGLLAGRSARMVTTMDSPRLWNVFMGRTPHHTVARGTLGFCGLSPVRQSALYSARKQSPAAIEAFIEIQPALAAADVAALAKRSDKRKAPALPTAA